MPKVIFVATVVKTHIMEFHIPYLQMFWENGWETAVAARNDYEDPVDCAIPYCDKYFDIPFERNPLNTSNVEAYAKLKKVIEEGNYDIIHCHTPVGGMLTRMVARSVRKKGTRVIYTAHGFHFFKGAPLLNWLVYYPVERWMAHYTDDLITINQEDYKRAKNFKAKRVHYVPGVGVDLKKFTSLSDDVLRIKRNEKRQELMLKSDDFVVLSVGEVNKNKNHEIVIRAIGDIKEKYYDFYEKIQYIICGKGPLQEKLEALAIELEIDDHIHFIGYRNDISDICRASDLFVFMSHREGLPVSLMEAMACGLPAICSNIRGNRDIVKDGLDGRILENSSDEIAKTIYEWGNDTFRMNKMGKCAQNEMKKFSLVCVKEEMEKIYFG